MSGDATQPAAALPWPAGYRSAAAVTFDLDAEAAILSLSAESRRRLSVMTHQAYGPLVGVRRILALLRRRGVRATFFVPGYTAERYPSVLRSIVDAGHEIGHHGYLHESMIGLDAAAEAAILDRGLAALHRVAGIRPAGYRAPLWEMNHHSPALLAERGFAYDSSLMDSDVPYVLQSGPAGDIVEIPVYWGLDDWEQYAYLPGITGSGYIASPNTVREMWTLEAEAMHDVGGCLVLTMHPFLTGRPARTRAFEDVLDGLLDRSDLWLATLGEIAAHVRSLALTPRSFPEPIP